MQFTASHLVQSTSGVRLSVAEEKAVSVSLYDSPEKSSPPSPLKNPDKVLSPDDLVTVLSSGISLTQNQNPLPTVKLSMPEIQHYPSPFSKQMQQITPSSTPDETLHLQPRWIFLRYLRKTS